MVFLLRHYCHMIEIGVDARNRMYILFYGKMSSFNFLSLDSKSRQGWLYRYGESVGRWWLNRDSCGGGG